MCQEQYKTEKRKRKVLKHNLEIFDKSLFHEKHSNASEDEINKITAVSLPRKLEKGEKGNRK